MSPKRLPFFLYLALAWVALALFATQTTSSAAPTAAISLSSAYNQTFDSLANTGTGITWTDDTTISGWYSTRTMYNSGTGSSNTGALYSFGATTSTERALGSVASGGTGTIYYGARFVNDTGNPVTSLTIAYTGEQWRDGGNATPVAQPLDFSYQVGATVTSLTTGTWTDVNLLDFVSPTFTTSAAALDGNAAANRVNLSQSVSVSIPAGQEIMLRWTDINDTGNDHGLAIDDLTVTSSVPGDTAPSVSGTTPANGATAVAINADISVNFSEDVTLDTAWYTISCGTSGIHTAAVTGGPQNWTLNPDDDFVNSEICTVTIDDVAVHDVDTNDPPDTMAADYVFSFTTVTLGSWVINEIHADPDPINGDANGDGIVNVTNDEFVEIVNNTGASVDISGWTLSDGVGMRHTFPSGTVVADQCTIVVFAGGTPTGPLGYGVVQIASSGQLGLNNAGDTITLNNGVTNVASYTYGAEGGNDQSLTRDPDISGPNPLVAHSTATGSSGTLFSPGTQINGTYFAGCTVTFGSCGDNREHRIHALQGSGLISPLASSQRVIEGIVTADYQNSPTQMGGFFIQEEAADMDANGTTSEGIYVFNDVLPVAVGDQVRLLGTVIEFNSTGIQLTEISPVVSLTVCSNSNPLPAPVSVILPVTSVSDWEVYEGMLVQLPQTLSVTEVFLLGRFGEVLLSQGGTVFQFTHLNSPSVVGNTAYQTQVAQRTIILDDGNAQQNADPVVHPAPGLTALNTLRVGDTVTSVSGVLDHRFGEYRIQPTGTIPFTPANLRPTAPDVTGGTITVASFNVLNYFNGNGLGGGFPTSRGATSLAEFNRQRAKTIAALVGLNADIVGLIEIENDATPNSAIEDLVAGLNAATAPGTYAFINTGVVGADEIRVALIYKPTRVAPVGAYATLTTGPFATYSRPPVAQTFSVNVTGEIFTVVINHLKSKGSACTGDPDLGDGQGNCNLTRVDSVNDMTAWLATDPTISGDTDFLVIGDMNAYRLEDPITAFLGAGFTNLIDSFVGVGAYSYVFDGQLGYLDHALGTASMTGQVADAGEWHINAPEPIALDYNLEFKSAGQQISLYNADAYRSSDHDPVLVALFPNDFSDLAVSYGTAWHTGGGALRLGTTWTADGTFGVDTDNATDDGIVRLAGAWIPGATVTIRATVTRTAGAAPAWLSCWMDWDNNGVFAAASERAINTAVVVGNNDIALTVPLSATFGTALSSRCRLYDSPTEPFGPLVTGPTGAGVGGEIEDYNWGFSPTAIALEKIQVVSYAAAPILFALGVLLLGLGSLWQLRRK